MCGDGNAQVRTAPCFVLVASQSIDPFITLTRRLKYTLGAGPGISHWVYFCT